MKSFAYILLFCITFYIADAQLLPKVFPDLKHIQPTHAILSNGGIGYVMFSNSVNGPFASPETISVRDSLFLKVNGVWYDTVFAEFFYDANKNGTVDSLDIPIGYDTYMDNGITSSGPDLDPDPGNIIVFLKTGDAPAFQVVVSATDGWATVEGVVVFQNPPAPYTLSGHVYDNLGDPIIAAMVSAGDSSGINGVTDNAGYYSIPLDTGKYQVRVSDEWLGGNHASFDTSIYIDGNVVHDFYLSMLTSYIRGFVHDENLNPIPNIDVWRENGNGGARTDSSGEYKLMVPPGSGRIGLDESELLPRYMSLPGKNYTIAENDSIVDNDTSNFTCYTANDSITGKVTENGSIPKRHYKINANSNEFNSYSHGLTNDSGHYSLPVHQSKAMPMYSVNIANDENYPIPPGMAPDTSYSNIPPGSVANFDIVSLTSYIRGYVKDELSNPIPNIGVWAGQGGQGISDTTDADGEYLLFVPPGSGNISLSGNDLLPNYLIPNQHSYFIGASDSIADDEISNFTCLSTNDSITGTVLEEGNPPVRQYMVSGWYEQVQSNTFAVTGKSGNYTLPVHQGKVMPMYNVSIVEWNNQYPLPPGTYPDTSYSQVAPGGVANFVILPAETLFADPFTGNDIPPSSMWSIFNYNNPWESSAIALCMNDRLMVRCNSYNNLAGLGVLSNKPFSTHDHEFYVKIDHSEMGSTYNSIEFVLSNEKQNWNHTANLNNSIRLVWSNPIGANGSWILEQKMNSQSTQLWSSADNSGTNVLIQLGSAPPLLTLNIDGVIRYSGSWGNHLTRAYVYLVEYNTEPAPPTTVYFDEFTAGPFGTVGVKDLRSEIPAVFKLDLNYPNPFNPTTKIRYQVPIASFITLKVFNLLGQEVGSLVNAEQKPGSYETGFNAGNLPGGVYFYRLTATDIKTNRSLSSIVQKALLIK